MCDPNRRPLLLDWRFTCAGLLTVFVYLLPYFILGEHSPAAIHDYLDSLENLFLPGRGANRFLHWREIVPEKMGGLPLYFYGYARFLPIGHWFLEPFPCFLVYQIISRLAAFVGMALLLDRHVIADNTPRRALVVWFGAAGFACLAHYPDGLFKVTGIPLVLWSYLNFHHSRQSWRDWLVVTVIPLYSQYFASYIFLLPLLATLLVWTWRRRGSFPLPMAGALCATTAIGLVLAYPLARYIVFAPEYTLHRVEFAKSTLGLANVWVKAAENFFSGHYHYASGQAPAILLAVLLALLLAWRHRRSPDAGPDRRAAVWILWILAFSAIVSLYFGFTFYGPFQKLNAIHPMINAFNFYRFIFLQPVTWAVAGALALMVILRRIANPVPVAGLILTIHFLGLFTNLLDNHWNALLNRPTLRNQKEGVTHMGFRSFYSRELFNEIKAAIGRAPSSYRVASLGLPPSVSIYNGFWTIDGYIVTYPLEYKHRFRTIMAAELAKDQRVAESFDNWGCRAYIYPAELETRVNWTKDENKTIRDLQINTTALRELGAEYVLSAVEIENAEKTGLGLVRVFERPDSPWRIFLYSVKA